jgi:hypothetical protein
MQDLAQVASEDYSRIKGNYEATLGSAYPNLNPARIILNPPPEYEQHPIFDMPPDRQPGPANKVDVERTKQLIMQQNAGVMQ